MPRFAALDVGTNTVLMAVAERGPDGRLRAVLERGEITRLGEGVDGTRRLLPQALERTAAVISRFAEEAREQGVSAFAACATSAARDATNGSELLALVRERARIELEILGGDDEARLVFRAVQEDFGTGAPALVAIDIGGGSTEVVWGPARGAPAFHQSVNVGSVRLTERFVTGHPIPEAERRAIRAHVREAFSGVPSPPSGTRAVAVAATATTLSAITSLLGARARGASSAARGDIGTPAMEEAPAGSASSAPTSASAELGTPTSVDPPARVAPGGSRSAEMCRASGSDPAARFAPLRLPALEALAETLSGMSLDERSRLEGLDPRRADVLCAGAYILIEALERLGTAECQVSDRGVRWGLLWERFGPDTTY